MCTHVHKLGVVYIVYISFEVFVESLFLIRSHCAALYTSIKCARISNSIEYQNGKTKTEKKFLGSFLVFAFLYITFFQT